MHCQNKLLRAKKAKMCLCNSSWFIPIAVSEFKQNLKQADFLKHWVWLEKVLIRPAGIDIRSCFSC
jgi:hypothetical protein